jgi:heme exporter protein C
MKSRLDAVQTFIAIASLCLLPLALILVFFYAPIEATLGVSQKIFYFHVSSAISMMACFGVCGIAGLLFLLLPPARKNARLVLDGVGVACAEMGIVLGAVVLVTGPLWAKKAWGTFWTWEPRLTLSLVVFLLFLGYVALRSFAGSDAFSKGVASGLAVLGIPLLYFIHFAVERWGGAHPQVVFKGGLVEPKMVLTFIISLASVLFTSTAMVLARFRIEVIRQRMDEVFLALDDMESKEV